MFWLRTRHSRIVVRAGAILAAGLLIGSIAASAAHADLSACRSDPVVYLSSGVELDLSATINDSSSDVRQVTYTVHAPAGTWVVAYVAGSLGARESWRFYDDNVPGHYDTVTVASTYMRGISVSTTTQAAGLIHAALVTVNGQSNQPLTVHLST